MPSTAQQVPGKPGSITTEDASWERVFASETSRLITYSKPWLTAALLWPTAWIAHTLWGQMPVIPWAMSALMLAAVGLAVFAWHISRLQPVGRAHSAATAGLVLTWLAVATDTGPGQQVTGGMLGIIGGTIAVSWNLRSSARASITAARNAGQDPAGRLSAWFKDAASEAGMTGAKMTVKEIGPAKATATAILPPGKTAAELVAKLPAIESAGQVPPGALTAAADPDQADRALVTLSDPRIFGQPIPWPGPSAPGTSIANPLRPGIWQDGEPVLYVIVGHHVYAMGGTGAGKALALDTPIPTPDGWTAMGDIQAGDTVFDEAGQPCQVTSAWDVRHGRPCYEVVFSDGSVITADAEHQWLADTHRSRVSAGRARRGDKRPRRTNAHRPQQYKRTLPQVTTTEQMAAALVDGKHANYSIRVAAPLACAEKELPVPPYTLGAWLGDGNSRSGLITSMDPEVIAQIEAEGLTARIVPGAAAGRPETYRAKLYRIEGLTHLLREAGIISPNGHGHAELHGIKHIPAAYLRASESQRRALLAGLLDTDGYCTKAGTAEFSVTCERLARDTFHLAASLGYKPSLRSKPARFRGKDCGTAWTVSFTTADKVFRLPHKAARQVTAVRPTAAHRYVTAIRPVPSVPVRCIAVDSPNHLFLAGPACIPTHNSVGGCWNLVGEIITRPDAAVFGADITKGLQTFGPLVPALHRFERTAKGASGLLDDVHSIIKPRTDYLAERGLQAWETGCGLSYMVVWLEETPDIWDKLSTKSEERAISTIRTLRSAGGTIVISLQRNTWDQLPTFLRSQMASMCFGLNDAADCRYGLSEKQQEAGVNPAEWGTRTPGKAVLDAPTIPIERVAMPLRTYSWGGNADLITAHAAAYPASARPVDPITAQICGGTTMPTTPTTTPARDTVALTRTAPANPEPDDDGQADEHDDDSDPCADYLNPADDPSPDITALAVDPDAPIEADPDDEPFEFDKPEKMSPEDAREAFAAQLAAWAAEGRETFAPRDLRPLMKLTGLSRAWIQGRLKEACEADPAPIERDDDAGTYRIRALVS